MTLSDSDRAAIDAAWHDFVMSYNRPMARRVGEYFDAGFLAGKRAGAAEQKEKDARICDELETKWAEQKRGYLNEYEQGRVNSAGELAHAIRSQPDEDRSVPHTR